MFFFAYLKDVFFNFFIMVMNSFRDVQEKQNRESEEAELSNFRNKVPDGWEIVGLLDQGSYLQGLHLHFSDIGTRLEALVQRDPLEKLPILLESGEVGYIWKTVVSRRSRQGGYDTPELCGDYESAMKINGKFIVLCPPPNQGDKSPFEYVDFVKENVGKLQTSDEDSKIF